VSSTYRISPISFELADGPTSSSKNKRELQSVDFTDAH
jgi:hypothetical protein